MATITNNDLKKLEDKLDKITETINQLAIGQVRNDLEKNQIRLEEKLKEDIQNLETKVNGINTRLDSQDKAPQKIPQDCFKVEVKVRE